MQLPCRVYRALPSLTFITNFRYCISLYYQWIQPLSYYLPLTCIKMGCAMPCITMPPVRIPCITVTYHDLPCTQLLLSQLTAVHWCALPCITVHSRVVAVQYSGIAVHVPVYMGDQNIDLRHWDNLSSLWHCTCSTSKLEISEFELDWFLRFEFESFEATYSIILKYNDILCCIK